MDEASPLAASNDQGALKDLACQFYDLLSAARDATERKRDRALSRAAARDKIDESAEAIEQLLFALRCGLAETIFRTTEARTREVPIMDVVEPAGPPEKERPTLHALVKGFSQHVRNVARYWRVPSRDVDDVTQEAFLRVHRTLSRYRPRAEGPQPWLTKITIRAAQNYLQRHMLQETLATDEATMEEAMDQTPNAEEQARFSEAARIACAIMRGLPEALREVYQLHLDGADERYIAELTHLPLTTVHKRLHHKPSLEALGIAPPRASGNEPTLRSMPAIVRGGAHQCDQ